MEQVKWELNVSNLCATRERLKQATQMSNSWVTHVQLASPFCFAAELYRSKQQIAYYYKLLPDNQYYRITSSPYYVIVIHSDGGGSNTGYFQGKFWGNFLAVHCEA